MKADQKTAFPTDPLLPSLHELLPLVQQLVLDGFRFERNIFTDALEVYGPPQEDGKHPLIKIVETGRANSTSFYLTWLWQERQNPDMYLAERRERGWTEVYRP